MSMPHGAFLLVRDLEARGSRRSTALLIYRTTYRVKRLQPRAVGSAPVADRLECRSAQADVEGLEQPELEQAAGWDPVGRGGRRGGRAARPGARLLRPRHDRLRALADLKRGHLNRHRPCLAPQILA